VESTPKKRAAIPTRAQKNSGWPPLRLPPLFKQFGFSTTRLSAAAFHFMR
jgi:hypothetical protein